MIMRMTLITGPSKISIECIVDGVMLTFADRLYTSVCLIRRSVRE